MRRGSDREWGVASDREWGVIGKGSEKEWGVGREWGVGSERDSNNGIELLTISYPFSQGSRME